MSGPREPSGPLVVPLIGRGGGVLVIPADELRWRFSRSSGPGGQGVNTADSRVELGWDVAGSRALAALDDDGGGGGGGGELRRAGGGGGELRSRVLAALAGRLVDGVLTVSASQHRQQLRNRAAARERLAAVVSAAGAPPAAARRATRVSAGARRRRAQAKQARSSTKALRRRPGPTAW